MDGPIRVLVVDDHFVVRKSVRALLAEAEASRSPGRRATAFAALVLAAPAWAAKVQVCHVPPGNPANFHTITINDNALQAHLGYGDLAGPCSAHCSQLCDDGDACTIDACDTSERCVATHLPVNCDDGNLCTTDTCDSATGCSSSPLPCLDSSLCTVDSCDPMTGQCVFPAVSCTAGQTCNPANGNCEGNACTPNPCQNLGQCLAQWQQLHLPLHRLIL